MTQAIEAAVIGHREREPRQEYLNDPDTYMHLTKISHFIHFP